LKSLGWTLTVQPRSLLWFAVGGAALSPLISLVASLLRTPEVRMDILDQLDKQPVILALFGVMAVTVAPLFEEMLFRGFLQPLLSRTFGVFAGILVTSVLFGALHAMQYKFVWQYVAAVSLVGAILGVVRYRTGSIITSSLMHACYNLVFVTEMLAKKGK
jgi:membrane protease YdiL (CAAX protease family)